MAQAATLAEPEAPSRRRRAKPPAATNGATTNGSGKVGKVTAPPAEASSNGTGTGNGLTPTGRQRKPMGDAHKAALAEGRNAGRAVRNYLDALAASNPHRRGRPKNRERMERRLREIEERIDHCDAMTRLHMTQEKLDLSAELTRTDESVDISALEAEFIRWAAQYGKSKHISYEAWRLSGVPRAVLTAAGIGR